jgi:hypothetical protein
MFKQELTAEFEGNHFRVVNSWFGGLKLYHEEELVVHNTDLFAVNKTKPLIQYRLIINEKERLLEVYGYAMAKVKLQIKIDGEKIAGDDF